MGWTIDLIDVKVLVLLLILLVFLILALMIIVMEYKIKKRKKEKFTHKVENLRLIELSKELKTATTPKEKLEVLNRHAKILFRERHNITANKSYAELELVFNEKQAYEYAAFCKKMFAAYYAAKTVDDKTVKGILKELIRLIRESEVYLNPDNYDPERLYATHKKEHITQVSQDVQDAPKHTQKHLALLEEKEQSLKSKHELLREKEKTIQEQEKELKKKELANERLLEELEKKIRVQEQKVKEQEARERMIEERLRGYDSEQQQHRENSKDAPTADTQKERESQKPPSWRDEISIEPIMGKDWIKRQRRGRRSNHR